MNISWYNVFRDRLSLCVALLILLCPIIIYCYVLVIFEQIKKHDDLEATTMNSLSEFEIVLDHINGALIDLQASYRQCDDNLLNLMYQLNFDLPGVEAFAVFNHEQQVICSNWLRSLSTLPVTLPERASPGLKLTGEEYISEIDKSGIVVYRVGLNNSFAAIISSAYLRQLLSMTIPSADSLVFYNRMLHTKIAVNGLVSTGALLHIEQYLSYTIPDGLLLPSKETMKVYHSDRFPSVIAAYFYQPKSWLQLLRYHWWLELLFCFFISLGAASGWLYFRYQKLNSVSYQIRLGLKRREFIPYLQPIVDMRNGYWIGAECLARWRRQGKMVAPPDVFIKAAEEAGLIKELTFQVIDSLGLKLQKHSNKLGEFYVSFNLSPNFVDVYTTESIAHFRRKFSLFSTQNIRFEITERGLSETNRETFRSVVRQLRDEGYLFGLDDFGTGQSGLEYFSNINPDFLKLDRRFVNAIDTPDSVDYQLLLTIFQLADSLKLSLIAEGVETQTQRQWLIDHGIFYGQGWLYQKAIPVHEFLEKMIENEYQQELRAELSLVSG